MFATGIGDAFDSAKNDLLEAQIYRGATHAETVTSFLDFCNRYIKWVPSTTSTRDMPLWMLSVFYFVLDQKPIVDLQTPIGPSYIDQSTDLSRWLHRFANSLGEWMDTEESAELVSTFTDNPEYMVYQYIKPNGGWRSFNDFFSRKVNPKYRPISGPDTVASPCDAKFDLYRKIDQGSVNFGSETVNLKGFDWPIEKLLQDVPQHLVEKFNDGIFMHSFLLPNNYHRVHAPVSGKVVTRRKIPGDVYLEVTADKDNRNLDEVKAQDYPGYQWNQARGMWIFDTTDAEMDIGHVVLFAVGMAQISSVHWDYPEVQDQEGIDVKKGDELGLLKYGGSDYILLFEKDKAYFDDEEGRECPMPGVLYMQGKALVRKLITKE
ncbi:hypothetical protein BO78DRAFT_324801 [Aspergillus sclerotiicarbonarius CBS 121057]|uniref:Phosphatidylserine decarboxylase n=1 Tax=Aspergillus sclerotiicarbonarius (strain CBS 121057 / IBT 28362) TaxID=1448318 RepID=A0A319DXV5_ASPSB|nr:hypothetical protein BO78DRAFT_324801 [Aspergillus sclerotiicarbonarius CBS 121057]